MGDDGQRDDVGMGLASLIGIVLVIAALVKYLFFRGLIRLLRRSTVHAPAVRTP